MITLKRFKKTKDVQHRKVENRKLQPIRTPRADEWYYRNKLLDLVDHIKSLIDEQITPELKKYSEMQIRLTTDAAPTNHEFDDLINRVVNRLSNLELWANRISKDVTERIAATTGQRLKAEVKRALGIDVGSIIDKNVHLNEHIQKATTRNVDLIKSIPVQYLEKVREKVTDNFQKGARWEDMVDSLQQSYSITRNRAKLIARDQASKMNSEFNAARQQNLGIEKYQWSTSLDERVRDSHAEKEGQIFRWNDPPSDTGHPGEDINCRCVAIPIFDIDVGIGAGIKNK